MGLDFGERRRGIGARLSFIAAFLYIGLVACLLGGCGDLSQTLRQSLTVVVPHQVDFEEMEYYAQRSLAAYQSSNAIRAKFPLTTRARTVKSINVLYFVETDEKRRYQTISIRGTANNPNIWQDIDIALLKDSELGVMLHKGFRDDAQKVYADLKPHIRKGYAIRVTGHSLGGAIAIILASYVATDGYDLHRLVTFGQPKVTDEFGLGGLEGKIVRVAHNLDVVADGAAGFRCGVQRQIQTYRARGDLAGWPGIRLSAGARCGAFVGR